MVAPNAKKNVRIPDVHGRWDGSREVAVG